MSEEIGGPDGSALSAGLGPSLPPPCPNPDSRTTAALVAWAERYARSRVLDERKAAADEIALLRVTLREVLAIARSWNLFMVKTMDGKPASCSLRLQVAQQVLDGPNAANNRP